MFHNVGRTIKILAKVLLGVGFGLSFLIWMVCLFKCAADSEGRYMVIGIATLLLGSLASWVNSILLYGFGSLIENSEAVKNKIYEEEDEDWYDYGEDQRVYDGARYGYNDVAEKPAQTIGDSIGNSLDEAIHFLNRKYNIPIELSDDLYAIKEKILKIDAVDNSTQIFKNRITDARSLDEAVSIIKMHCTINR